MAEHPDSLAAALRRIGFDPGAAVAAGDTPHPDGWLLKDTPAWRAANARSVLATVPPGFRQARIGDCPPSVLDWARQLAGGTERHPWLRLHGGSGRGKTHCAWALTEWMTMHAAHSGRSLNWRFVTNAALNDELRPKPDGSHAWAADKYMRAQWLVLDDFGSGNLSDFTVECTLRILNYRYDQWLPLVITSNLGIKEIGMLFGDRIGSRIERATPVIFDGPDRRLGA